MKYWLFLLPMWLGLSACERTSEKTSALTAGETVTVRRLPIRKFSRDDIVIEKQLLYDRYTLSERYPYRDTVRFVQMDKIRERLFILDSIQQRRAQFAVLQNRSNRNGEADLVRQWVRNSYDRVSDRYGVEKHQSVPLFALGEEVPERYGRDGSLVKITGLSPDSSRYRLESYNAPGEWEISVRYVTVMDPQTVFTRAIMIDRHNQNISPFEKSDHRWLIRSINPATTGVHHPPYAHETPEGLFVVQEKKEKMYYLHDGTSTIAGYAPWASRFCNGAYIHGVPTNSPSAPVIEYSSTLGIIPRSHMCVRNASSHSEFVFDWTPVFESVVFVFE
ncbi:MAG: L,D-transpeptidase [Rikenellaceae bacterium]|nr:L,D-transpeptidase [Rikenellaceae bacterium]